MPTYYALLQDFKTVISKTSLDRINEVQEPIAYLLRQDEEEQVMMWGGNYTLYTYTSINLSGNVSPIELPDFILIDIGKDQLSSKGASRKLVFKEKITGELRTFYTFTNTFSPEDFIKGGLVEHCQQLEKVRSYQAYDMLEEIQNLKSKNEQLEARIKQLNEGANS